MLTWTEPDITFSVFNFVLIVVSIEEVNEFKLPVLVSIALTLVNALDVNEFKLPVLVSIDVNLPLALEVNEFKLPVEVSNKPNLVFWFESVVAIEEDNKSILELIELLKVE